MYPFIGLALSTARNSLPRNMSSLTPGNILQGAHWNYRILSPVMGDHTHISTVFKAVIVPRMNTSDAPKAPQLLVMFIEPHPDSSV